VSALLQQGPGPDQLEARKSSRNRSLPFPRVFSAPSGSRYRAASPLRGMVVARAAKSDTTPMPAPYVHPNLTGSRTLSGSVAPVCNLQEDFPHTDGVCKGSDATGQMFGVWEGGKVQLTYHWTLKADGSAGAFFFDGRASQAGIWTLFGAGGDGCAGCGASSGSYQSGRPCARLVFGSGLLTGRQRDWRRTLARNPLGITLGVCSPRWASLPSFSVLGCCSIGAPVGQAVTIGAPVPPTIPLRRSRTSKWLSKPGLPASPPTSATKREGRL
jgi:hypothetical protein